jgi:hypothetical protein
MVFHHEGGLDGLGWQLLGALRDSPCFDLRIGWVAWEEVGATRRIRRPEVS